METSKRDTGPSKAPFGASQSETVNPEEKDAKVKTS